MPLDVPVRLGDGPPIVLLHGFAMRPSTYEALARLLAERCSVFVPDLFAVPHHWRYHDVLDELAVTIDALGLRTATLIGHSFGGAIELGYAARAPERVRELVFSDTLANSREWRLAGEALRHPLRILRLATPLAAGSFADTVVRYPAQLAAAGWWAFRSSRTADTRTVAAAGVPTHVLWANRDSILSRSDGALFAEELHASFTVAVASDGRTLDHDWMFQQPEMFVAHLDALGLAALGRA